MYFTHPPKDVKHIRVERHRAELNDATCAITRAINHAGDFILPLETQEEE